jgi:hypothetical protein
MRVNMRSCRRGRLQFKKGSMMWTPWVHLHTSNSGTPGCPGATTRSSSATSRCSTMTDTTSWASYSGLCQKIELHHAVKEQRPRMHRRRPNMTAQEGPLGLGSKRRGNPPSGCESHVGAARPASPLMRVPHTLFPPRVLGVVPPSLLYLIRVPFVFQLEFCFTSSFSYIRPHTNTWCPLWFRTPPSSDIKIARLKFLFILQLRTRIVIRDQADVASTRSVSTRS